MPRRKQTDMQKLTPEQQKELIERYQHRNGVREANSRLATLALSWFTGGHLTEQEFMEQFNAGGHHGEYHQNPSATVRERVMRQAAELSNLTKRLADTPLDYMGAVELSYVYARIKMM